MVGASTNYSFSDRVKSFAKNNPVLKAELDEEIEKMELIQKQKSFDDNLYKSLINLRDYCKWADKAVQDHIAITLIRAVFEPILHKYIVEGKTHDFSKSITVQQSENKARTGGTMTSIYEPYTRGFGYKEGIEGPHLRGINSDQFLTNLVCVSKYSTEQCKEILESYIYAIKGYSQNHIQKWLNETRVPSAFSVPYFDLITYFTRLLQYLEKVASNQDDSFRFIEEIEEKVTKNQDISLDNKEQTVVMTPADPCSGKKTMQMLFYALQVKNSFIFLLDDNYEATETYKIRRKIKQF